MIASEYATITAPTGRIYIDKKDLISDIRAAARDQFDEGQTDGLGPVGRANFDYGANLLAEIADAIEEAYDRPMYSPEDFR